MKARSISLLVLCWISSVIAHGQKPIARWNFNDQKPLKDLEQGIEIDTARYHCNVRIDDGASGNALVTDKNCFLLTNVMRKKRASGDLSIEFMFRGRSFMYTTLPDMDLRVSFDDDYLQFVSTNISGGKKSVDNWIVNLRGAGVTSYNYLANGDWHHFVFLINAKTGTKEIWIDGVSDNIFTRKLTPFEILQLRGFDGFRADGVIDDIAFYDRAIKRDKTKLKGSSPSNNVDVSEIANAGAASDSTSSFKYKVDSLEFAPGYPNYTVQATDQLRAFPAPRFSNAKILPRNFPWLDISYLHRELPGRGGVGLGISSPDRAVELVREMVGRWNYYADIPCLRIDSISAQKRYSNPTGYEKALIDFSNANPDVPISTVIMQIQNNPSHAGFDRKRPYIIAQDLPEKYYLMDNKGKAVVFESQKWLSPLAPLDIIKRDALTTSFYLRQLSKHLNKPFDMLNDNGEVFGHMRPAVLLDGDPNVVKLKKTLGLNNAQLNGWFQNRLDSVYRVEVLKSLGWSNTYFTFYNTSAVNPNYWPDYYYRRGTNTRINGEFRSTPSFYPAFPWNWKLASGPYNGYGVMAEGRRIEIGYGDRFFAPFVCAGWDLEEKNMRPAQWLGLLKAMVMLGADFFHVGYFNVTGKTGWPNGKGPNDPRGYVYQAAMPVYAQAIASRIYEFLEQGKLLQGTTSTRDMIYRIPVDKSNNLVMIRKLDHSYLIYGTVQPNANYLGNTALTDIIAVEIEGKIFRFQIRRQGSFYKLDLRDSASPVVIQLDGWHQYEHPFYWSKNILIEAENADQSSTDVRIGTIGVSKTDFRSFRSFSALRSKSSLTFHIPAIDARKYIGILTLRNTSKNTSSIKVEFDGQKTVMQVTGSGWKKIPIQNSSETTVFQLKQGQSRSLKLTVESGSVDLDELLFENIN